MNVPRLPYAVVHVYDNINGLPRAALFVLLGIMNLVQILRPPYIIPDRFDYIVVGGGVAGCVVASRLSEDPDVTVLLLEAGGEGNILTRLPASLLFQQDSVFDWKYRTVPLKFAAQYLNNNEIKLPAGKILGGGSMLNGIMWVRGIKYDFERWTKLGITGWSYEENLPYYIRSENVQIESIKQTSTSRRGFEGPIVVTLNNFQTDFAQGLIDAGGELGYRTDYDYNDKHRLGFARMQSDLLFGQRYDSARGYIDPVRNYRTNLVVLTHALATRVLFDEKTAIGMEYEKNSITFKAFANKEVIIAAGGVGSPKLLLLSGVGPAKHLQEMGIKQIHELPVGKHLTDHMGTIGLAYSLNRNAIVQLAKGFIPNNVSLSSPLALFSNFNDWTGFINTKTGPHDKNDHPDIQMVGFEIGPQTDLGTFAWRDFNIRQDVWEKTYAPLYLKSSSTIIVSTLLTDPKSRGEVRLRSTDPHDNPIIDLQWFSHPEDRKTIVAGAKFVRSLFMTEAMKKFEPKFMNIPLDNCSHPNDSNNDGYLECLALGFPTTIYHYSGTMRMGASDDPDAVIDNQMRMKGLNRIRVVDTSILPYLPSGNPQATNYMIAEKAADIIKGRGLLPPIYD